MTDSGGEQSPLAAFLGGGKLRSPVVAMVSPTIVVAVPSAPTIVVAVAVAAPDLDHRCVGDAESTGCCGWHCSGT